MRENTNRLIQGHLAARVLSSLNLYNFGVDEYNIPFLKINHKNSLKVFLLKLYLIIHN
jgi:hypothetical protein